MYIRDERDASVDMNYQRNWAHTHSCTEPILMPTTKSEREGDMPCSGQDVVNSGCVSRGEWKTIEAICIALFSLCASSVASSGLILADTKFEIGRCPDTGELLLIDEVLTPDASRFWMRDSYEECLLADSDPEVIVVVHAFFHHSLTSFHFIEQSATHMYAIVFCLGSNLNH